MVNRDGVSRGTKEEKVLFEVWKKGSVKSGLQILLTLNPSNALCALLPQQEAVKALKTSLNFFVAQLGQPWLKVSIFFSR